MRRRPLVVEERHEELDRIYNEQVRYVWNSLRRLNVPERDVEDLCQEVFLKAFRNFDDYDSSRPIQPWLFGIAFRVASDYREKASNAREKLTDPDPPAESPDAIDNLSADDARELVMQALEGVDMDRRAIFVLHQIDDHPMSEVAESLSIPLQTAYSRFRAAEEQFKEKLRSIVGEEVHDE